MADYDEITIKTQCNAVEHRAVWLALIYDEMQKAGIEKPEEILKKAVRRCGVLFGERMKARYEENASFEEKVKYILPEDAGKTACKAIVEIKGTTVTNTIGYCPLVNAWKKLGLDEEQCGMLCDITMEGDKGIAQVNGLDLHWNHTLARGAEECDLFYELKQED